MVEDPEELFTLGMIRNDCHWGLEIWATYRADNLAGLVNHGDRLAERCHGS